MVTYYGGQCQLNLDANCSHLVIPHPSGVSACVLNDYYSNTKIYKNHGWSVYWCTAILCSLKKNKALKPQTVESVRINHFLILTYCTFTIDVPPWM